MKIYVLIAVSFITIISSCKKTINESSIPTLEGIITMIDENNRITKDYSGINISCQNLNMANINVDNEGKFNIPDIANDQAYLKLNIAKSGYGTTTVYFRKSYLDSCKTQGNSPSITILPVSTVKVNSLAGVIHGDFFKISYAVTLTKAIATNGVRFLLMKNNPQVSHNNFIYNNNTSKTWIAPVNAGSNEYLFCYKQTYNCNCDFLFPGDTVYVKAYGESNTHFGNTYLNFETGFLTFPSINTNDSPPTISFIVP